MQFIQHIHHQSNHHRSDLLMNIYKCQLYLSYFPMIYLSSINASNYRKYHHSSSINGGISQYLCRSTIRSPCPASRKDSSNSSALSMRPASIDTTRTVGLLKPIELYLLQLELEILQLVIQLLSIILLYYNIQYYITCLKSVMELSW